MPTNDQSEPTFHPEGPIEQQVLSLRFVGHNEDGSELQELRAEHVADVLEGLTELTQDFEKAGAFHNSGPGGLGLFVRPAKQGSFIIELAQWASDIYSYRDALGFPSIGLIVWWAAQMAKDQLKDFTYLENGNIKVIWRSGNSDEITPAVWEELNKRDRRRRKQLRKLMRPLEDSRVTSLETKSTADLAELPPFTKSDYQAIAPDESEQEVFEIFETTGNLSAVDFDDPDRWRIRTKFTNRIATIEDEAFLEEVANGLQFSVTDTFQLKIREDKITKNGRTTTKWTILDIHKEGEEHDSTTPDHCDGEQAQD